MSEHEVCKGISICKISTIPKKNSGKKPAVEESTDNRDVKIGHSSLSTFGFSKYTGSSALGKKPG